MRGVHAPGRGHDWFDRPGAIVFIAALMGLLSLAIELCVPALGHIAAGFGLADATAAQAVITLFVLSFGLGHLFQGFLADRYGRKPVLLVNLAIYAIAGAACAATSSFEAVLAARAVQGIAAAGCRVAGTAALRDVRDGPELARAMSLAMMIFSGIPVLAPFVGQAAAEQFGYRAPFVLLTLAPLGLVAVAALRMPETWPAERRRPVRLAAIRHALARMLRARDTTGYTAVAGILYGMMFGFIASALQLYGEVFGVPSLFAAFLSSAAVMIGLAAYTNARVVRVLGPRKVVTVALGLIVLASAALFVGALFKSLNVAAFHALVMLVMFGNGLAYSNCSVLAIQPHGDIAGVASAIVGGATMMLGAVLSHAIGQAFDGTEMPLAAAFLGLAALATAVERATAASNRR